MIPLLFLLGVVTVVWALVYAAFLPAYRLGPATNETARPRARRALAGAVILNVLAAAVTPFMGYAIFIGVPLLFFLLAAAIGGLAGRYAFVWGALGCLPFPLLAMAYGYATEPERMGDVFPMIGYASVLYLAGILGAAVVSVVLAREPRAI